MTHESANSQGPYLQAAMLCEQILDERDGVKSAIRIIDRVTRTVANLSPPAEMEPFEYKLKLLLKFKSGRTRGPMKLQVKMEKPSGESPPPMIQTVYFEGDDDRGIDIVGDMAIKFEMPGLYWFDVELENRRVTRIPLRVIYLPQVIQMRAPPGGSPPSQESPPGR